MIAVLNFLFGGASDFDAVVPGIVAGTLAVFVAWRLAQAAFGSEAAIATSIILATSGIAIAFGRSAMTESMFVLMWLLAMLAGARFLTSPGPGRAIMLGIAVGLAQLTKYNGALTGVIVSLTAVADVLIVPRGKPRDLRAFRRRIFWGIFAAIIAAGCYAPWFLFVEDHGGYRELMRHHGGYVTGLSRWIPNLRLQLAQGWVFQRQPLLMVLSLFMLANLRQAISSRKGRLDYAWIACLAVLPNAPAFIAAWSVPRVWSRSNVAGRMIAVWLVTMFLLTPIYHPYARLWLPFALASLMLSANFLFGETVSPEAGRAVGQEFRRVRASTILMIAAYLAITFWTVKPSTIVGGHDLPSVWSDRSNLRKEIGARVDQVQEASNRGRAIHLLLNPAGRRALALELGARPLGQGRFVVVESFGKWRPESGPILVDLSLLTGQEANELPALSRGTSGSAANTQERQSARRGLITLLDLAPGVALGEPLPLMGIEWIDR
jgi:4-amino-4-deoxy-L-arabinose transferase-like glycosyltransferase